MRKKEEKNEEKIFGAKGRTRTDMILLSRDFESRASTNFATLAFFNTKFNYDPACIKIFAKAGVPKRSRTSNRQIRSLILYPIELWAHDIF